MDHEEGLQSCLWEHPKTLCAGGSSLGGSSAKHQTMLLCWRTKHSTLRSFVKAALIEAAGKVDNLSTKHPSGKKALLGAHLLVGHGGVGNLKLLAEAGVQDQLVLRFRGGHHQELMVQVMEALLPAAAPKGCAQGHLVAHGRQARCDHHNIPGAILAHHAALEHAQVPQHLQTGAGEVRGGSQDGRHPCTGMRGTGSRRSLEALVWYPSLYKLNGAAVHAARLCPVNACAQCCSTAVPECGQSCVAYCAHHVRQKLNEWAMKNMIKALAQSAAGRLPPDMKMHPQILHVPSQPEANQLQKLPGVQRILAQHSRGNDRRSHMGVCRLLASSDTWHADTSSKQTYMGTVGVQAPRRDAGDAGSPKRWRILSRDSQSALTRFSAVLWIVTSCLICWFCPWAKALACRSLSACRSSSWKMPSRLPGDGCQGMLDATKAVIGSANASSVYTTSQNASIYTLIIVVSRTGASLF